MLVVDLVMKSQNHHRIFVEAVELGIALLEGGNREIQDMLYEKLKGNEKCQNFFKVGILMKSSVISVVVITFVSFQVHIVGLVFTK